MNEVVATPVTVCPMCASPGLRAVHRARVLGHPWMLVQCAACGQHCTSPRPTQAFLDRCYSGDYHQGLRATGATERRFGPKYRRYVAALTRHLSPGARILDIGCATGLLVRMLCERGYDAIGIELNRDSARWGSAHYGVTILDRRFEDCGFDEGRFDAVVLTDVLEHTLHPRDYLEGVSRTMRSGGVALVSFPDIGSVESRYYALVARATRRPHLWVTCNVPLHIWEFTEPSARRCFEEAGFDTLELVRTQERWSAESLPRKLIAFPTRLLELRPVARRFGTQMEFLLRKR